MTTTTYNCNPSLHVLFFLRIDWLLSGPLMHCTILLPGITSTFCLVVVAIGVIHRMKTVSTTPQNVVLLPPLSPRGSVRLEGLPTKMKNKISSGRSYKSSNWHPNEKQTWPASWKEDYHDNYVNESWPCMQ